MEQERTSGRVAAAAMNPVTKAVDSKRIKVLAAAKQVLATGCTYPQACKDHGIPGETSAPRYWVNLITLLAHPSTPKLQKAQNAAVLACFELKLAPEKHLNHFG